MVSGIDSKRITFKIKEPGAYRVKLILIKPLDDFTVSIFEENVKGYSKLLFRNTLSSENTNYISVSDTGDYRVDVDGKGEWKIKIEKESDLY